MYSSWTPEQHIPYVLGAHDNICTKVSVCGVFRHLQKSNTGRFLPLSITGLFVCLKRTLEGSNNAAQLYTSLVPFNSNPHWIKAAILRKKNRNGGAIEKTGGDNDKERTGLNGTAYLLTNLPSVMVSARVLVIIISVLILRSHEKRLRLVLGKIPLTALHDGSAVAPVLIDEEFFT